METNTVSDKGRQFESRLIDLSYGVSEDIFGYLEHVGYIQHGLNEKRLWGFLEVVAFVLFWIERTAQKRVFGRRGEAWTRMIASLRNEWGNFFSGYPEGPPLDDLSQVEIADLLLERTIEYDGLFRTTLEIGGSLHAHNTCSTRLLHKVERQAGLGESFVSEETHAAVVHHLGRTIQDLIRQVDAGTLENPF